MVNQSTGEYSIHPDEVDGAEADIDFQREAVIGIAIIIRFVVIILHFPVTVGILKINRGQKIILGFILIGRSRGI